jgi:hypothetical protein
MAHFARIENNMVTDVQVLSNDVITNSGVEVEQLGVEFLNNLFGGEWVQTSYSGKFRKNFAGIGWNYDKDRDAFISPKPYESWVLDEATCLWVAPIDYPADGGVYTWDESEGDWVEVIDEAV